MGVDGLLCAEPRIALDDLQASLVPWGDGTFRVQFFIDPDIWVDYQSDPEVSRKVSDALLDFCLAVLDQDLQAALVDIQVLALGGNPLERKAAGRGETAPAEPAPVFPAKDLLAHVKNLT